VSTDPALLAALELLLLPPIGWFVAVLWGALWGSFFNVAIHRVGLYESVTRPRSRCPRCGRMVRAVENIPIVSWLMLRGKCAGCRLPISVRYPLVEALSAVLAGLVYYRFVASAVGEADVVALAARFLVYFAFVGTLLVISGIDYDHKLIPDRITYPAVPLFFLAALVLRDVAPTDLLIGIVAGYGIVAVVIEVVYLLLKREGMGYGDAKLLMLVGAMLGWKAVLFSFFVAPFFGVPAMVPALVRRGERLVGTEVPYGPFLALAALVYLFFGKLLIGYFLP
jgi:leader peptidase (prepilin peptidase)/N-methyltransferase